jgi:hypothetical protein
MRQITNINDIDTDYLYKLYHTDENGWEFIIEILKKDFKGQGVVIQVVNVLDPGDVHEDYFHKKMGLDNSMLRHEIRCKEIGKKEDFPEYLI